MRYACVFLLVCFAGPAFAQQDTSRGEIFIGYSYLSADTNGLTATRESVPYGVNLSFVANFSPWVGAEINDGTYYKKISGVDVYDYSLLFGPRFHYRWAFFHALFGMDDLAGRADGLRANQASPSGGVGGGGIFKLNRHIGVEGSADYAFTHHNILGGPGVTQNNFRLSAGVVFTFGYVGEVLATVPSTRQPEARPAARGAGMQIASLGLLVVPTNNNTGAEIKEVAPNGIAELAGLHPGDLITAVNGVQIKTPMELANALSGVGPGTKVRLAYLIRVQWQTEITITPH